MPAPQVLYRLAAFTKNRSNPAYAGARLGADRVAARLGCTLTHHVPEKADDVDEQRALLERALAERPDAILLGRHMPPSSIPHCSGSSMPTSRCCASSAGRTISRSPPMSAPTIARWRAALRGTCSLTCLPAARS